MANKQPHRTAVSVMILSLLLIGAGPRAHAITEPRSPSAHFRSGGADCGGTVSRSTHILHSFVGQSTPVGRSQSPTSLLCSGMGYTLEKQVSVVVSEETGPIVPQNYLLHQNFPNPFNPNTTIRYQLAGPGAVKVAIHDLLGQEVRVMVSEKQLPDWYRVSWDGNDEAGRQVSSGVYLYRLGAAGEFLQTRKMVLVR
ncbi:MAG: T9SS type A sorting domain-containing protein [Candidatus Latescibacterota bacterium]